MDRVPHLRSYDDTSLPPAVPPPPTAERRHRRRVDREVSSRYMSAAPAGSCSPMFSSSSSSDPHIAFYPRFSSLLPSSPRRSKKPPHHQKHRLTPSVPSSPTSTDSEPDAAFANENFHGALQIPLAKAAGSQKKRFVRLFHENVMEQPVNSPSDVRVRSRKLRPGTPIVYPFAVSGTPRPGASSQNLTRPVLRRISSQVGLSELKTLARANPFAEGCGGRGSREASPEANNSSNCSETELQSISSHGRFCNSPLLHNSRVRKVTEFRSSMTEADLLTSSRRSVDGGSRRQDAAEDLTDRVSSSLCYRSLSSALSNCQLHQLNGAKLNSKPPIISKPYSGTAKAGSLCLPQPHNLAGPSVDTRKGRKADDVHSLQLLHNCYLQWRFANMKAQAAVHARTFAAEKSFYDVSNMISELQKSVASKRIELEQSRRTRSLSTIVEMQVPYLEDWNILAEDYSSSLSGATKALQDASLRLPVASNADVAVLNEVLDSSTNVFEALSPCVEKLLPQAEVMEDVTTELAKVVRRERTMIEECADLLAAVHQLQLKDCSLRGQLLQQKRNNST